MKDFFSKENENQVQKLIIIVLYGLCLVLNFLAYNGLFNNNVNEWIGSHTSIVVGSVFFLLMSWMLGIVSKSDLFGAKSFTGLKFAIFVIQFLIGLGANDETIASWGINKILFIPIKEAEGVRGWIFFTPTFIYIIRTFLLRFQKIEKSIADLIKTIDDKSI